MGAWIYVFDHARFAVTDAKGQFKIENVPPGKYRLVVRQPDGGLFAEHEVEIAAENTVQHDVEFSECDLNIDPGVRREATNANPQP